MSYQPGMLMPMFWRVVSSLTIGDVLSPFSMRLTYHCDGNGGRIGEDELDFVEHAAAAPVLSEGHPGWSISQLCCFRYASVYCRSFHTIQRHCRSRKVVS
jgi:hypothetical protein